MREFARGFRSRPAMPFLVALVSLLCPVSLTPLVADVIVTTSGRRIGDVEITEARWDQVRYEMPNGQATSMDGEDVLEIERDSVELSSGRRRLEAGEYEKAYQEFRDLAERLSGWQQAEAAYRMGEALLLAGEKRAIEAFQSYLSAHRDSKDWFVPQAKHGLGRAALAAGQTGTARKHFEDLAEFGPNWERQGQIGLGRTFLAAEQYLDARRAFGGVANDRRAPDRLRREALARRVEVVIAQEQYDAAIEDLRDAFFSPGRAGRVTYDRARARATLLMGIAHQRKGGQEGLEEAEIWFLKVVALYGSYPEERAEATAHLADVYAALGRDERAAEWRAKVPTGSS